MRQIMVGRLAPDLAEGYNGRVPERSTVRRVMQFTKRLREPVKRGEVTTSVRIWKRPHVKVGNRCALEEGHIVVDKLHQIDFDDITPSLARASGFAGVADLLKTAKHGAGENVYLVEFHYEPML
jgi:hypothetical protein